MHPLAAQRGTEFRRQTRGVDASVSVLLRANATGLRVDSKAQAEQVRSVAVERIGPVLGRVPTQLMAEVDEALRLHLQL